MNFFLFYILFWIKIISIIKKLNFFFLLQFFSFFNYFLVICHFNQFSSCFNIVNSFFSSLSFYKLMNLLPDLSFPLIFFFLFLIFFDSFYSSSNFFSLSITSFDALSIVPISSGRIVIVYHGIFSNKALTSFSYR